MKRALIGIIGSLLIAPGAAAQAPPGRMLQAEKALSTRESSEWHRRMSVASLAGDSYDVRYYRLDLRISTPVPYLRGAVTIDLTVLKDSLTAIILDLNRPMQADSVSVGASAAVFSQGAASLLVELGRAYRTDEPVTVRIVYEGVPGNSGFGSFVFDTHSGTPWVWSLSEPYGARDWWPCKDQPADKADSSDVIVTCDSAFRVGSNGALASVVNNGDGTTVWHWQERYPIAPYLVSVALTNFSQFTDYFRYTTTDSMEVLNYFIPEDSVIAKATLPLTIDMLRIYSDLFGLYPFIREKYGHAEINASSAMEHQTMTSLGPYGFNESTISHELAHQWFGDMITCRNWPNIWLNEGFAEYSTALYLEREHGKAAYWDYMTGQMFSALDARGTIYVEDTSGVATIFDTRLVYCKGATVLHMLRHVLGDSMFFRAMKGYAGNPSLRYASAVTEDFQAVCESVSGRDLSFFFDEWIHGEKYPRYAQSWTSAPAPGGYVVTLSLSQTTGTRNPVFFTMPLDMKLSSPGWDTTVTVLNSAADETFRLVVSHDPASLAVDPDGWVLKTVAESGPLPAAYALSQNYPNPFNPATRVEFQLPVRSWVSLKVYDLLGRVVAVLADREMNAGWMSGAWDGSEAASGVYFYRLEATSSFAPRTMFRETKKMVLVR